MMPTVTAFALVAAGELFIFVALMQAASTWGESSFFGGENSRERHSSYALALVGLALIVFACILLFSFV